VEQLDALTGEVLHIYPSGVSAGRAVGIGQKAISDCCHGRRQTSGGFKWRFHQISPGDETQSFIGTSPISPVPSIVSVPSVTDCFQVEELAGRRSCRGKDMAVEEEAVRC
jgi:hypothetical protein